MEVNKALKIIEETAEHLPDCQARMREALTEAAVALEAAVVLEAEVESAGNAEVIKALTICGDESAEAPCWDRECPYRDREDCQQSLARDALRVIKNLGERKKDE